MLRILTYNVHSCIGTDGRHSLERIAAVIAACEADVVLLQEIDVGRLKTGRADQAARLAGALGMTGQFHAAMTRAGESYGDAILSRPPMRVVQAGLLPGPRRMAGEPRGALWVEIQAGGQTVQVVNCHLGLLSHQQAAQLDHLLGPDWTGGPALSGPAVLGGDFNAPPSARAFRRLAAGWTAAFRPTPEDRRGATFPSRRPWLRLDHLWHRGGLHALDCRVVRTPLARLASDHLPLVADFAFQGPGTGDAADPFDP